MQSAHVYSLSISPLVLFNWYSLNHKFWNGLNFKKQSKSQGGSNPLWLWQTTTWLARGWGVVGAKGSSGPNLQVFP